MDNKVIKINTSQKMTENEKEIIGSQNDNINDGEGEEDTELDLNLEIEDDADDQEDIEALRKRISTLEAQKAHWKNKAGNLKVEKPKIEGDNTQQDIKIDSLSLKDQASLFKSEIDPEDYDEVIDFAKFKKISVSEAIKNPIMKATISEKNEFRKSALAANSGQSKRTSPTATDEAILKRAKQGFVPEKEEDYERLFNLRKGIK